MQRIRLQGGRNELLDGGYVCRIGPERIAPLLKQPHQLRCVALNYVFVRARMGKAEHAIERRAVWIMRSEMDVGRRELRERASVVRSRSESKKGTADGRRNEQNGRPAYLLQERSA